MAAKLRLNKEDKDKIMRDVKSFVITKYAQSSLGDERNGIIAEVQAVANNVFKESISSDHFNVLMQHGCVANADKNFIREIYLEKERGMDAKIVQSTWHYIKDSEPFMIAEITLPAITSHRGGMQLTGEIITDAFFRIVNAYSEKGRLSDRLWTISDKMNCEVKKIIGSYRSSLEQIRYWEDAIDRLEGMERMVNPRTIKEIRDSKNPTVGIELDPQVVLFGKEVKAEVKEKKNAKRKVKN